MSEMNCLNIERIKLAVLLEFAEILFEFPKDPNGRRLLVYVIPGGYVTFQAENQCDIAPKPAVAISGLNTGPSLSSS